VPSDDVSCDAPKCVASVEGVPNDVPPNDVAPNVPNDELANVVEDHCDDNVSVDCLGGSVGLKSSPKDIKTDMLSPLRAPDDGGARGLKSEEERSVDILNGFKQASGLPLCIEARLGVETEAEAGVEG